jgi:hypothetical protein
MKLTDEEFKSFKNKLLNEYSEEKRDELRKISTEDIKDHINFLTNYNFKIANGDYNILYMPHFPIIDELVDKLKNINICIPCEIKEILRSLSREMLIDEIKQKGEVKNG